MASAMRLFQAPASIRSVVFNTPCPLSAIRTTPTTAPISLAQQHVSPFSTTPSATAKGPPRSQGPPGSGGAVKSKGKGKGKGGYQVQQDPKIVSMKKHLSLLNPRFIPPPLRMARNRHLRHWTIHRAWQLFRRQQKEAHDRELMRMHQGMHAACEELRLTEGPGTREEGYLYRVAMEKKGVYGPNGVPIEYARLQTETPAREAWKHDWKAAQ